MAEPAPPVPSSTTRDRSACGSARRKAQAQPEPSVLWPTSRPPSNTTVFTAPMARASGDSSSSSGSTACLQGKVMFRPAKPMVRAALIRPGSASTPAPVRSRSISW
jgi:hypothetical protein